jgi:hypothetical protein
MGVLTLMEIGWFDCVALGQETIRFFGASIVIAIRDGDEWAGEGC